MRDLGIKVLVGERDRGYQRYGEQYLLSGEESAALTEALRGNPESLVWDCDAKNDAPKDLLPESRLPGKFGFEHGNLARVYRNSSNTWIVENRIEKIPGRPYGPGHTALSPGFEFRVSSYEGDGTILTVSPRITYFAVFKDGDDMHSNHQHALYFLFESYFSHRGMVRDGPLVSVSGFPQQGLSFAPISATPAMIASLDHFVQNFTLDEAEKLTELHKLAYNDVYKLDSAAPGRGKLLEEVKRSFEDQFLTETRYVVDRIVALPRVMQPAAAA